MEKALLFYLPGWFLMLLRTGGVIFTLPIFGRSGDSKWARIVIIVAMATLFYLPNPIPVGLPSNFFLFAVIALREILVGLLLGMGVNTVFGTIRVAGEIIGHDMGLNMSKAVDPTGGKGAVVMATFFETLTILLFFVLNGHHAIFRMLSYVNETVPLGSPFDIERAALGFGRLGSMLLENAILVAAPVFAIMILLTLTMLILSRAVPQIHLMEFGFALRIVVALMACVLFIPRSLPHFAGIFDRVITAVAELIQKV